MIDGGIFSDDAIVPDSFIAEDAHVTLRTIREWSADPKLDFPAVIRIRGRKYRRWGDYQKFKKRQSEQTTPSANAGWQVTQTRPRVHGRFSAGASDKT
jgi:hypothetical protein